ncbi:hypothetical protein E4U30_003027 [Claviceps sp. LM220 group G6]|nr:hypothetical protein E4U15_005427 [Claviceps sp. LM218 group G6]KAG6094804.1 hypothetical protein E4U30_003027 [Claviceps sp. LM220 group G6]KAG6116710.1 hypothetical protein E4U14_008414 [Claviceps sp. LM454 group G7]
MRSFSLLTLLLPFVVANDHTKCDCMSWTAATDWIHNAELTHYVCLEYYPGSAKYDDSTKRCVTTDGAVIDGQTWENDCKKFGKEGYYTFGSDGHPDFSKKALTVGAVAGSCPN